ncbi:LexA family protein [Streptomyces sp. NPDC058469]|uniref:LexA family protein n=1 Tax=Streptomyces sp. NPDC058469 TaxID=3346514 RepID=UPI00365A6EE7
MREIGQAVHLASTSSVAHQLMALESKGVLYRDPHCPRAYRVRPAWAPELDGKSEARVHVPLVGRIAAGAPLLAEEMVEGVYPLPRQVVGDGDLFATAWELQRHRRWPDSSNPYFFVTRYTAVDDSGPPISAGVVQQLFQRVGLRLDRIVDEARHSADPVRLMELFGQSTLSATLSATGYALSVYPDRKNGLIAP